MSIFDGIGQKERDLFQQVVSKLEARGGTWQVKTKGWIFKRNEWEFRYKGHNLIVDGIDLTYMNSFYSVINCLKRWIQ